MYLFVFFLKMRLQIGGVPIKKSLSAMLAFAPGDILIFSGIVNLNLIKFPVHMAEVELRFLAL